jgi:hypothetical protein
MNAFNPLYYYIGVVTSFAVGVYLLFRLAMWLRRLALSARTPSSDRSEAVSPEPNSLDTVRVNQLVSELSDLNIPLQKLVQVLSKPPAVSTTLDKSVEESAALYKHTCGLYEESFKEQARQSRILEDMAGYLLEVTKQLRRLNRKFSGEAFDDVTDERAQEIERINDLMDRTGIGRQEATERIRSERTYTRDSLGIGDRRR